MHLKFIKKIKKGKNVSCKNLITSESSNKPVIDCNYQYVKSVVLNLRNLELQSARVNVPTIIFIIICTSWL